MSDISCLGKETQQLFPMDYNAMLVQQINNDMLISTLEFQPKII